MVVYLAFAKPNDKAKQMCQVLGRGGMSLGSGPMSRRGLARRKQVLGFELVRVYFRKSWSGLF